MKAKRSGRFARRAGSANTPPSADPTLAGAAGSDDQDWHDDDYTYEGPTCGMCGDDGWIMLSDAGPSEWGEDCFCEIDRPIECPECRARRRYEAAMAKRPNSEMNNSSRDTQYDDQAPA